MIQFCLVHRVYGIPNNWLNLRNKEFLTFLKTMHYNQRLMQLSKPQLNHNSTQPNISLNWIIHENDFAHHTTHYTQKLNVRNILAVTHPIWMKL